MGYVPLFPRRTRQCPAHWCASSTQVDDFVIPSAECSLPVSISWCWQVVVPRSQEASISSSLDPAGKGVVKFLEFLGAGGPLSSATPIVAPPSLHDVCMRLSTVFNAWALVRTEPVDAVSFLRSLARLVEAAASCLLTAIMSFLVSWLPAIFVWYAV